jgi:hypothetical protein
MGGIRMQAALYSDKAAAAGASPGTPQLAIPAI